MNVTQEQQEIVDYAKTDHDFRIMAFAGTGKTTTLTLVAKALPRNGQYIAFNTAIVNDSKQKFPSNVRCNTAHSLAFHAVGKDYAARLNGSQRLTNRDLAQWLNVEDFMFICFMGERKYKSTFIARLAKQTVNCFCKTPSLAIGIEHVPDVPLITEESYQELVKVVVPLAQRIWDDLQKTEGTVPFGHDHYLKIWQLGNPKINCDYILFDEAQDADPVMLTVVNDQDAQLVICGDSYQSIYEWRGALDALEKVLKDSSKLYLTQSFRFGQVIANEANDFLMRLKSSKPLIGSPHLSSTIEQVRNPNAILCRTNGGVVANVLSCLMRNQKVAVVGGVKKLVEFAKACGELIEGRRTGHPELAPFKSWREVLDWITEDPEDAGEIATMVRLVESYGVSKLIDALDKCAEEHQADVIISTAHRAKGREWETVRLYGDFLHRDDMKEDELRLAYVAVTRARQTLDLSEWKNIRRKAIHSKPVWPFPEADLEPIRQRPKRPPIV